MIIFKGIRVTICYQVLMEMIYFLVVTEMTLWMEEMEQITLAVVAELILLQISVPFKGMLNQAIVKSIRFTY